MVIHFDELSQEEIQSLNVPSSVELIPFSVLMVSFLII